MFILTHADGRTSELPYATANYTNDDMIELAEKVNSTIGVSNPVTKIVNTDNATSAGGVVWLKS